METFNPKEFSKTLRLIAGFINNTLSAKEHDELDEWVNASPENQKVFEECLEIMDREILPHEDTAKSEPRFIAELLVKHFRKETDGEEKEALEEWAALSPANTEIYSKIMHSGDIRELYYSLRDLFMKNKGMLN